MQIERMWRRERGGNGLHGRNHRAQFMSMQLGAQQPARALGVVLRECCDAGAVQRFLSPGAGGTTCAVLSRRRSLASARAPACWADSRLPNAPTWICHSWLRLSARSDGAGGFAAGTRTAASARCTGLRAAIGDGVFAATVVPVGFSPLAVRTVDSLAGVTPAKASS